MEVHAKKSLGQNFLTDDNVLNKIASSTNAKSGDLIIEIGPGMGALTKKLVTIGAKVIAFEIDERMKPFLNTINSENLEVKFGDFLNYDLATIDISLYNNVYIIANIPYYISTPIIKKILESNINFSEVVLLVQKEYAERLCAKPKTKQYDSLTIFVNYHYDVNELFGVNRKCFNPSPKVDSAVIKLFNKHDYNDINKEEFLKFINVAFTQKRKTLKNNLYNYDWNKVSKFLVDNNISLTARPEELSIENFIGLYKYIS